MTPNSSLLAVVDLGMLVLKIMAVAGGAAVGGFGSGLLVSGMAKATVHKTLPKPVLFLVRVVGAVVLGWIIYLLAFGSGGSGFGFGSGGSGTGTGGTQAASTNKQDKGSAQDQQGNKSQESPVIPPGPEVLRIDMLGGSNVQNERFYVVDGVREPKNLTELRQYLLQQKEEKGKTALKAIQISIYRNSVNKDHPAVSSLQNWARANDLEVTLAFPERER